MGRTVIGEVRGTHPVHAHEFKRPLAFSTVAWFCVQAGEGGMRMPRGLSVFLEQSKATTSLGTLTGCIRVSGSTLTANVIWQERRISH